MKTKTILRTLEALRAGRTMRLTADGEVVAVWARVLLPSPWQSSCTSPSPAFPPWNTRIKGSSIIYGDNEDEVK